jgi:ATP-dependent protease HslVU (ClpYQ) peptidase subunit
MKEGNKDVLYLASDRRVTNGDKLVSDNNVKTFVRINGQVIRYYATCGDVGPTDYLIERLEQHSIEVAQSLLFEDEFFKALKATFVMFLVEVNPTEVKAYEMGIYEGDGENPKNTLYAERLSLEELKHSARVMGSGGEHVLSALKALQNVNAHSHNVRLTNAEIIQHSFTAASKVVLSINDKIDLFKFKLPKVKNKW